VAIAELTHIIGEVNVYSKAIVVAVNEQSSTRREIAQNIAVASVGANEVAGNIQKIADNVAEISNNVTAVKNGTEQSSIGINQIDSEIRNLNESVESLNLLVNKFQV
jgi:methyl-accepting chemotaxis protein